MAMRMIKPEDTYGTIKALYLAGAHDQDDLRDRERSHRKWKMLGKKIKAGAK